MRGGPDAHCIYRLLPRWPVPTKVFENFEAEIHVTDGMEVQKVDNFYPPLPLLYYWFCLVLCRQHFSCFSTEGTQ